MNQNQQKKLESDQLFHRLKDVSTIGPVLYFRMFVRHKTLLPQNHVTFIAMHDSKDNKVGLLYKDYHGKEQIILLKRNVLIRCFQLILN